MLGADHVRITIDGRRYELRPSLRAAFRLERDFGLSTLAKGLDEGNATVILAVIRETARRDSDAHLSDLLDRLGRPSLAVNMSALRGALADVVVSLYGIDSEAAQKAPEPGAKTVPHIEHLTQLYKYATGWLGWTPAVALNATPIEIIEAFRGHVDMLTAIHGGKPEAEPVDLDTKARVIFGGLKQRFLDRQAEAA